MISCLQHNEAVHPGRVFLRCYSQSFLNTSRCCGKNIHTTKLHYFWTSPITKSLKVKDKRRQEIRIQCFPTDFQTCFTGDVLGGALAAEKAADEAEGFAREAEAAADEVSAILQSMKAGKCCSMCKKESC